MYVHMCYTVLFTSQNFTLHSTESRTSLWSRRRMWQQSENSMSAKPLIGIKHHTPKQFSCGCDKHVKQDASLLPSGQSVGRLKDQKEYSVKLKNNASHFVCTCPEKYHILLKGDIGNWHDVGPECDLTSQQASLMVFWKTLWLWNHCQSLSQSPGVLVS